MGGIGVEAGRRTGVRRARERPAARHVAEHLGHDRLQPADLQRILVVGDEPAVLAVEAVGMPLEDVERRARSACRSRSCDLHVELGAGLGDGVACRLEPLLDPVRSIVWRTRVRK